MRVILMQKLFLPFLGPSVAEVASLYPPVIGECESSCVRQTKDYLCKKDAVLILGVQKQTNLRSFEPNSRDDDFLVVRSEPT